MPPSSSPSSKLVTPLRSAALAALIACGSSASVPPDAMTGAASDAAAPATTAPEGGATSDSEAPDAAAADAAGPSRCKVTDKSVSCTHVVTRLVAGTAARDVYWQTPATPPPAGGYPVVIIYQGSYFGPSITWAELTPSTAFGGFHQGRLQAMLLDSGFTVIAPEAAAGVAWQTNSTVPYELSTDKDVIDKLLAAIENGEFGPANLARLYATGISSGGYMSSRMAISHPGKFRALAIQSASYATCLGAVCNIPSSLPADHPPTLFLHGALDTTVPLFTAERYYDKLVASGIEASKIVDDAAGHEWLAVAPVRITEWFVNH